jgi:hypothetical protein
MHSLLSVFLIIITHFSVLFCSHAFVVTTTSITCTRSCGSPRVVPSRLLVLASATKHNKHKKQNNSESPLPYVPSGMTLEEYQALKQKETLEESKKNYGAWGPRFARSSRPQGDWMVLSRLWTHGTVIGPSQPTTVGGSSKSLAATTTTRRILDILPAFVLSIVLMDSLITAMTLYRTATELTLRKIIFTILRLRLVRWNKTKWICSVMFAKIHVIKAVAALFATPLIDTYFLARVNRYKLWSKRKTALVSTIGSMGLLGGWALLLLGLRKSGVFC